MPTEIAMKLSLLGIISAIVISGVNAAELDCKNTQTAIERMICSDANLTQFGGREKNASRLKHQ
ncbi:exported protein of unknown function (plasmid) [Ralstonia solanacearum CMR15]|nr:exported protein of unknown function [Ralstonia solanacearum CMR15]